MYASIDSIETFGLLDGPGIRTVVFFTGCPLRCKFCHNPEMWQKNSNNYDIETLFQKIIRNKPYFKRNNGGVTFSGGEPLLQVDFLIEICKKLKEENIHITLDTCGVGIGKYEEILKYIDLVILDIKYAEEKGYFDLTNHPIDESEKFIEVLNKSNKKVWIRQVIVPEITDSIEYMTLLAQYLKKINNIEKIEFLPFHHLGFEKYKKLNLENPLINTKEMSQKECDKLYQEFQKLYKSNRN